MKKTLLLICGGRGGEHEISIVSARYIASLIQRSVYEVRIAVIAKNGVWYGISEEQLASKEAFEGGHDQKIALFPGEEGPYLWSENGRTERIHVAFPIVHGIFGEDGALQGHLDMMNVPYVGTDKIGSVLCMQKHLMKDLLSYAGIPVAPYRVVKKGGALPSYEEVCEAWGNSDLFIKPAAQGSSLGVEKVSCPTSYHSSLANAFCYGEIVLIEKAICGREIECSVLGHLEPEAALYLGEIKTRHTFYSYEAKYLDPEGADLIIPAHLSLETSEKIRVLAVRVFQLLGCSGLARVDFLLEGDTPFINEVNTLPGFTPISLYPKLWEVSGMPPSLLVERLIDCAYQRFSSQQAFISDARRYREKAEEAVSF